MFNLFKKKENEIENSSKYTLKNVGDVQYFKKENRKAQQKSISAWATYQGLKVSFRSGSFVCAYGDETFVEAVLRVEVVGKVQPRRNISINQQVDLSEDLVKTERTWNVKPEQNAKRFARC